MLKILLKNISHTNRKQNQFSKFGSAQTVVLKIRALRKRTRNRRAEIGNEFFGVCYVMFGELVFMTIRDSEAFEKSSSLFQGFLKFID